jgi:hypothetical protein
MTNARQKHACSIQGPTGPGISETEVRHADILKRRCKHKCTTNTMAAQLPDQHLPSLEVKRLAS